MLITKLKTFLKSNDISVYQFAKAVKNTGVRTENWAYRLVRGELSFTMESLELVISVLSKLTGKNISVADLLVYEHSSAKLTSKETNTQLKKVKDIAPPLAIAPEGTIDSKALTFIANPVDGTLNYTFSIFHYRSKVNIIYKNTAESSFRPPQDSLCPNVEYGWKVKAFTTDGWSAFSTTRRFVISDNTALLSKDLETLPLAPKALSPMGIIDNLMPTLRLTTVINAVGYSFYLRNLVDETLHDFEFASKEPFFKIPADKLKSGGKYKWNARAYNCAGFSTKYSNSIVFEVKPKKK